MSDPIIEVGRASPPHRRRSVAEMHAHTHEGIDVPAEIYREGGRLRIALYSKTEGQTWDYPLGAFISAIGRGVAILEEYYEGLRTQGLLDESD